MAAKKHSKPVENITPIRTPQAVNAHRLDAIHQVQSGLDDAVAIFDALAVLGDIPEDHVGMMLWREDTPSILARMGIRLMRNIRGNLAEAYEGAGNG